MGERFGFEDLMRALRGAKQKRETAKHGTDPRSPLQFEALESRLLLSADISGGIAANILPDLVLPGDSSSAAVTIKNSGTTAISQAIKVDLYASLNGSLDSTDILLGSANSSSARLNPGQTKSVTVALTLPNTLDPGAYQILAVLDGNNKLAEGNEANNVILGEGFNVAWKFGDVAGRSNDTVLKLRDADGTNVTFRLDGVGTGEVIRDGNDWDVKLTGTNASSILQILPDGGGDGRVKIDDLHVMGSLGAVSAPKMDLVGTLAVNGPLTAGPLLGSATNATIVAPTITGANLLGLTVRGIAILGDLKSSEIRIGGNLGADGQPGGTGANADTYGSGRLGDLVIGGKVTSSFVRVGQNPVDGVFDNGDDVLVGGSASSINSVTILGTLSSDSRVIAGSLPTKASIQTKQVTTATDPRFKTDVHGPDITLVLQNDTGALNNDRLTNDAAIRGQVVEPGGLSALKAGFGTTPAFNILADVRPDGSFVLSRARLEAIKGGPLADGLHTLVVSGTDRQGNTLRASLTFTLDTTAPTVVLDKAMGQADPTGTAPILYAIRFSEAVTGLEGSDVYLDGSAIGGNLTATIAGSGTDYVAAVSGMVGTGIVYARLLEGAALDLAGNASQDSTTSDNSVGYDGQAPSVTINQAAAQSDPTNTDKILFSVQFSEPISGFTAEDVDLSASSLTGLAVAITGGGANYTVEVSGMQGVGTVVASIAAGAVFDSVGNLSTASTSTDNSVTFDNVAPTVTIDQASHQVDPTNTGPVEFQVTFSEDVTGFTAEDLSFEGSTVGGTLAASIVGSGASYTVWITGMNGKGDVIASIDAHAATDPAGNASQASTSTDNGVAFDNVAPTVTINQTSGQQDSTEASPILFSVIFSEDVVGFDASDLDLSESTFSNLDVDVTGSGAIYEVAISGMTGGGTVVAFIGAGAAVDMVGNTSTESTSTDNRVNFQDQSEPPTLSINDVVVNEGDAGTSAAVFTVSLSQPNAVETRVRYATGFGSAIGDDYSGTSGNLAFAPGEVSKTISVSVKGDIKPEADETFGVKLSNAVNATIEDGIGQATIVNDDWVGIRISDDSTPTGSKAIFEVTLTGPSTVTTTVDYVTADGTGVAGVDYVPKSGTITFAPGETTKFVTVDVTGAGGDKTFFVNLVGVENGQIEDTQGQGTVQTFSPGHIKNVVVTEAQGIQFDVRGTFGTGYEYEVISLTAVLGSDFQGPASSAIDWFDLDDVIPGTDQSSTKRIGFSMVGNQVYEFDEMFRVQLFNGISGALLDEAICVILNDDPLPTLTISGGGSHEEDINPQFFVTRTGLSDVPITIEYGTANGSADSSDYTPTSGTLTFGPLRNLFEQNPSKEILVSIARDNVIEPDEQFFVNLLHATNAVIVHGQSLATIENDDVPGVIIVESSVSIEEGNSGTKDVVFTVRLLEPNLVPTIVNYATGDGTATPEEDFVRTNGSLVFEPGELVKTIAVPIIGDTALEEKESFFVRITSVINGTATQPFGFINIENDDTTPLLSISDASVIEGDEGDVAVFMVHLAQISQADIRIDYSTRDGTALAGLDYEESFGTFTIRAGMQSGKIVVPIISNPEHEGPEAFFIDVSNPVGVIIDDSQGEGTIREVPRLSVSDLQIIERDNEEVVAKVAMSLSRPSDTELVVSYRTLAGTATVADYRHDSGIIRFEVGETVKMIEISVVGDLLPEDLESFFIDITAGSSAPMILEKSRAEISIINDDDVPLLSISNSSSIEGDFGSTNMEFEISLSNIATYDVVVNYSTIDQSAKSDADYIPISSSLTIPKGNTRALIQIPIIGDSEIEANEQFLVNITSTSIVLVMNGQAHGEIRNDDAPSFSINDVVVNEGDAGTSAAVFTVSLSQPNAVETRVRYATGFGSAIGDDYSGTSGNLAFAPGEVSKTISVSVKGDIKPEADETFGVKLSNAVNATIEDGIGQATIVNDDWVGIRISDDSTPTGSKAIFEVTLTGPSTVTTTVDYVTADGTGVAGVDYVPKSGTITFAPGETTKFVTVDVTGAGGDKTFFVNLVGVENGQIEDTQGQGTVQTFSPGHIKNVVVTEAQGIQFDVRGTFGTGYEYEVISLTAVLGSDFQGPASSAIDWFDLDDVIPGTDQSSTKRIGFSMVGNQVYEFDEMFRVQLFNGISGALLDEAICVILNDDPLPTLTISGGGSHEEDINPQFFVTRTGLSDVPITIEYGTANGSADSSDYTPTSGTLTFGPLRNLFEQNPSKEILVSIARDNVIEPDEQFFVNLLHATNAVIVHGQSLATIENDDVPGVIIVESSVSIEEGNSGTKDVVFTVRLLEPNLVPTIVNYATGDGTATPEEDFVRTNGSLVFEPGELVKTIAVPIIGDTALEEKESFFVRITSVINGTATQPFGFINIENDDTTPLLSISDASVIEGDEGATTVVLNVTQSGNSNLPTSVEYFVGGGSASGLDYIATSGILTFGPDSKRQEITITITGDMDLEANEKFFVKLFNPLNSVVVDSIGEIVILDDEDIDHSSSSILNASIETEFLSMRNHAGLVTQEKVLSNVKSEPGSHNEKRYLKSRIDWQDHAASRWARMPLELLAFNHKPHSIPEFRYWSADDDLKDRKHNHRV